MTYRTQATVEPNESLPVGPLANCPGCGRGDSLGPLSPVVCNDGACEAAVWELRAALFERCERLGFARASLAFVEQRYSRRFWMASNEERVTGVFEWGVADGTDGERYGFVRLVDAVVPGQARWACPECDDPAKEREAQSVGCALLLACFGFGYLLGVVAGFWNWGAT